MSDESLRQSSALSHRLVGLILEMAIFDARFSRRRDQRVLRAVVILTSVGSLFYFREAENRFGVVGCTVLACCS